MRVTMIAIGSRGDVQPFVALGLGLKERGYAVRIATHTNFSALVTECGLEFSSVDGDPQSLDEIAGWHRVLEEKRFSVRFVRRFVGLLSPHICAAMADCWRACQDADVIVASQMGIALGYHVAEKLGVPLVRAFYSPISPTRDYPAALVPTGLHLGERLNLWSHHVSRQVVWLMVRAGLNRARDKILNLEPLGLHAPMGRMDRDGSLLLYGYSPVLFPRPTDWGDWIDVTGHWFLDRPACWRPPPGLVDFLESGPPPVSVGFGSMRFADRDETTETVVKALTRMRLRGVLLTGWGGGDPGSSSDDIYVASEMPHDWLFPQMVAAVHHGGVGTTHACLRAGVPSVVMPFLPDQRFWADRLSHLGVGARPISHGHLSVDMLTERLRTVTQDRQIRSRSRSVAIQLQAEDGVQRAVMALHAHMPLRIRRQKRGAD